MTPLRPPFALLAGICFLPAATAVADDQTSDGSATAGPSAAQSQGSSGAGESGRLSFQFRHAPWEDVFELFAEKAGLTLDLTDTPPGSFNYVDDREHTIAEAIDVLNGYLLPRSHVMIRRNEFLVVTSTADPYLPNLIPTIPAADLNEYGDKELLRLVVPVRGFDAEEVAEQVEGLLGAHGSAAPLTASDSIVVQGFGQSLREMVRLLDRAEAPVTDDELVFRMFALNAIPAADAERQVRNLFGLTSNPYAASRARSYDRDRRRDDDDDDRNSRPAPLMANLAMNMKISSLARTNSLLITATASAVNLVEEILETIDVAPDGDFSFFDDSTPVLRVYTVENADEDDVAETIDAVMPGVVINEDGRQDTVHILATPREHQEVESLIRIIDAGGTGGGVEVITLRNSDPYVMSDLLNSLFENEDRDDRPVITPDFRTRSLAVRASGGQMEQIKQTLAAYGEGPAAASRLDGRFRRISLPTTNVDSLTRAIKELLGERSRDGNPIRVVIPSETFETESDESQPAAEEADSPTPERIQGEAVQRESLPRSTLLARGPDSESLAAFFAGEVDSSSDTSEPRPGEEEGPSEQTDRNPQRITVEVHEGELLIYSNDQEALDQVEETIRELVRQFPSRTEWTVFYLRAAAAETAATQLAGLLRDSQSPLTATTSMEIPTAAYGVQTLRIIPDQRTNALFVSGPRADVDAVENFLGFLDRMDLPESLRDRVPRSIPVRHASVHAIAEMVRELYKDYLEDPNARARESRRDGDDDGDDRRMPVTPQAAAGEGLRPPGIRLTVAVDAQASELLVSCNEALFQQIRDLVDDRDRAAFDSRPTFRVIEVRETGAQRVAESLGGLSPRITVSSSSSAPRGVSTPDRSFLTRDRDERPRETGTDGREESRNAREGRRDED